MRKVHFIVFIWIFVITNSCVHHKITFGSKHQKKVESEISETSDIQIEKDLEPEYASTEVESETKEPGERLFNFVENKIDQPETEKIIQHTKSFIQKTQAKNSADKGFIDSEKAKNENEKGGLVLTIIGSLLILLSVVVFLAAINHINNNESTVDGCLTSVITGTMLLILGIALGAVGLILLIMGIVFFATDK